MVVVIDKILVERLAIEEQNTIFQEELIEGGIFLRLLRLSQFNSGMEEK